MRGLRYVLSVLVGFVGMRVAAIDWEQEQVAFKRTLKETIIHSNDTDDNILSEPVANLWVLVESQSDSTLTVLQNLQTKMDTFFELGSQNSESGTLTVTSALKVEEEATLTLSQAPTANEKTVIIEATRRLRCGEETDTDYCDVKEADSDSRKLLSRTNTLDIVIEEYITEANIGFLDDRTLFADSDFVSSLATTITEVSTSLTISMTATVSSIGTPAVTTKVHIVVLYQPSTSESAVSPTELLEDIHSKAQNTTTVTSALDELEGVTFGAVTVDLCRDRTCFGQGTCSEGTCTCNAGFVGSACEFAADDSTGAPTAAPVTSSASKISLSIMSAIPISICTYFWFSNRM